MGIVRLLSAIDRALDDKTYRRKLVVRAIEDAIVLLSFGLWIAAGCAVCTLVFRWLGVE